jgi:hypothetical protein
MSTLDHPAKFAEATFTTSIRRVVSSILGDQSRPAGFDGLEAFKSDFPFTTCRGILM